MSRPVLILASASPRRAALLRRMGLKFLIRPARTAEEHPAHLTPAETARLNACRKARAVAAQYPQAIVLGADTIVCLGRRVLGKPASLAEARRMLARLQGRTHQVVTGVCLLQLQPRRERSFAVSTAVTFRRLGPAQIRDYLARINPLDKAGAYAIQEHGDRLVARLTGSLSNVVGLPVERLAEELAHWGVPAAGRPKVKRAS